MYLLFAATIASCSITEFVCDDGHCISSINVCNDVDDCGDGGDEDIELCKF